LDQNFQNSIHNFMAEYIWLTENLKKETVSA